MQLPSIPFLRILPFAAALLAATNLAPQAAHAQQAASNAAYTVLYSFTTDGDTSGPYGAEFGSDGNLWSVVTGQDPGGTDIFRITPSGTATIFGSGGSYDEASGQLCLGTDGDLYGTSYSGVYKIDPSGNVTYIYKSPSSPPYHDYELAGTLVLGSDGNFYGVGVGSNAYQNGAIMEITPAGAETVVFAFSSGGGSGADAGSPPTQASDGNFYGTTAEGGANNHGEIYELTPSGALTVLYSFTDGADGAAPVGGLAQGADGNFYGLASSGGANGSGTVYSITPTGGFTLLHTFGASGNDNTDGTDPVDTMLLASDGNFYGTTYEGGADKGGTLFQLTPSGTLTTLYSFPYFLDNDDYYYPNSEGSYPDATLIEDDNGILYGTTGLGGYGDGGTLYTLTIDGLTNPDVYKVQSVTFYPASARSTATTSCTITLSPGAPPGGATVTLSSSSSLAPVPSSLSFPAGARTEGFNITPGNVMKDTNVVITATYNGTSQSGTLTITPPYLNYMVVEPTSVGGGSTTTGTLELSPAAPSGGFVVNLSSNSDLASVPASVTVPAGQKYAEFEVTTSPVSSNQQATITASFNGSVKTAPLTITPATLQSVACAPATTTGGATTGGNRVYFNGDPVSDSVVNLSSSDTTIATVPSTVTVKAGTSNHSFPITAAKITTTKTVTITAKFNGVTETTTLTVKPDPNAAKSVTLSPASIVGGQSSTANRVYLYGDATANTAVTLTSSNTAVAMPKSTTVQSGSSSHVFTIDTSAVTTTQTVTITATADGVSQSATLTVTPPPVAVKSLTLSESSTVAENSVTGTVTLSNPAPSGGAAVSLSSSSSSATVPSSVTVAAGATTATFSASSSNVSSNTKATITASYSGTSQSASLTITPRTLKSVVLSPTSTKGGTATTANQVNLYSDASANEVITLTSSNPSVASVPSSVTISAGSSSQMFTITTTSVSTSQTVAITASYGSVSQTATLTVTP